MKTIVVHPIIDEAVRRGFDHALASRIFLAGVRCGKDQHGWVRYGQVGEPGEPISRTCLTCGKQFQNIVEQIAHSIEGCKP